VSDLHGDVCSIFLVNSQTPKHGAFSMIPKFVMEQLTSPRSKKARMSKSQVRILLISFLGIKGIVHFEFITQGQRVGQAYYVEILRRSHEAVRRKRLNFGPRIGFSTTTNVPAHKALSNTSCPKIDFRNGIPTLSLILLLMTSRSFQK
jgi:hypothetical protein